MQSSFACIFHEAHDNGYNTSTLNTHAISLKRFYFKVVVIISINALSEALLAKADAIHFSQIYNNTSMLTMMIIQVRRPMKMFERLFTNYSTISISVLSSVSVHQ